MNENSNAATLSAWTGMVPVEDTALAVTDTGGTGIPVLYRNGQFATQGYWKQTIAELGSGFRHITFDERARGKKSKTSADYSFEACVRDVDAVLAARGVDKAPGGRLVLRGLRRRALGQPQPRPGPGHGQPTTRVEDARSAVDFLTTLPYVDAARMGVFGICAGGGYAISVAQTERRFKAVATVSAAPMGEGSRAFLGHTVPASEHVKTLEAVAAQRTAEANGAEPVYAPFVPETMEEIDERTPDMLREGYDYYRTPRGQHPRSKGRFLFTSMDRMFAFSAFDQIPNLLTQPMLLIAGSRADTKIFSDQAYALANGPKELFVVEGATHIAMYDVPEYVDQAVAKMTAFFAAL